MRILTGFHAIEETLRSTDAGRGELYLSGTNPRLKRLADAARAAGAKVKFVKPAEIDALVRGGQRGGQRGGEHRGAVYIAAEGPRPRITELPEAVASIESSQALVLILDQVTDPHNLGAMLRSADQFDADLVVLPSRRSAHITDAVETVSAGASNYVRIAAASNLARGLAALKDAGFWIYGADMSGRSITEEKLSGRTALVMGSEGKGLSRLLKDSCDALVSIPSRGHVDSFNVSVAAGICMYEIRRQQGFPAESN